MLLTHSDIDLVIVVQPHVNILKVGELCRDSAREAPSMCRKHESMASKSHI